MNVQPAFSGMDALKLDRVLCVAPFDALSTILHRSTRTNSHVACAVQAPLSAKAYLAHFWGAGRTLFVLWHAGCWTISSGRATTRQNRPGSALLLGL